MTFVETPHWCYDKILEIESALKEKDFNDCSLLGS